MVCCAIGYFLFGRLSKNLSLLTIVIPVGLIWFDGFFVSLPATIWSPNSCVGLGVSALSKKFQSFRDSMKMMIKGIKVIFIMMASANILQKLTEQGFGLVYNGREYV